MEQQKIQDRLASLKTEFEAGQTRLRQLEGEQSYLRETLLRISGAIQVLQEIQELAGDPPPKTTRVPHNRQGAAKAIVGASLQP